MNALENNKLISEFMGINHRNQGNSLVQTSDFLEECYDKGAKYVFLEYNQDWNQLMCVVEKIENLGKREDAIYRVTICNNVCKIDTSDVEIAWTRANTKIKAVYTSVITFIKWYNETAKTELSHILNNKI